MLIYTYAAIAVPFLLVLLLVRPAGWYLAKAFDYNPTGLDRLFGPLERLIYRIGGHPRHNQTWRDYAVSLVLVNTVMLMLAYLVFRLQGQLPLNAAGLPGMRPDLAFHTAVSFITGSNLQHYSGESGLSYLSQMMAVVFLMFAAPATSLAAAMACIRALADKPLGNFYVDLVRALTRVLLPAAFVLALVFVALGTPQTLEPAVTAQTVDSGTQTIARGPVGSFVAIKMLGTNGGGFFGANSAHPYENPGALSNLLQIVLMLLIPAAIPLAYGRMTGHARHGRVLFIAMGLLLLLLVGALLAAEHAGNPALQALGLQQEQGSMEGKENRFGVAQSAVYTAVTTASETGAVNTMHDTLSPIGGLVALISMLLNTVFGGIGSGFMNVLLYAIVAVFLSGLMVGRTPEFLGKKIEVREMKLIAVTLLITPLLVLVPSAWAVAAHADTISSPGFHGLTQAVYEFASAAANNGSGFEGLADNTRFWNTATGVVMMLGRYVPILLLLAIAASLSVKRLVPQTSGTFRTDTGLFGVVFVAAVLIVGALTFFPVLALGPIAEHLSLWQR
ncbi:potassium-transporting ATPase subunit KdpA [Paenibacillus daejeonensis]|uniref:potassium-transporting ATPase subunit KdpA n=1 Tax=Paenibacillus daejeonensis TaxID=135193 RepID=UPI0003635FAF|nr:potassium-transporting ATPase subunit KdpA [Paenibacillus daejeonensis]